jgi:oligopeptidase B
VIAARDDAFVEENFTLARSFIAAKVRTGGLDKVVVAAGGGSPFFIDADEPAYEMDVVDQPDPDAAHVRYDYQSMVAPPSVIELDPASRARRVLKEKVIPGYDRTRYITEYLHAPASDGAQIPISLVARKDTPRNGTAPTLVYGYGSYGVSTDPVFEASRISLLDRGWVFANAHVRGGQELGRSWYEDGKLMHKRNTFTDFIAVTEYLVATKLGARDRMFAYGASAGGLLMGAIANLRPDLYRGIIAEVPFVDVVTTMLDESIPLTTNEFDEWGNPAQKQAYDYMLSYSPYDNVRATGYPSMYVKTALWDSQVQYYEPAKWVARQRATKTDHNLLVLDIDMHAGHGGHYGRYETMVELAREYAFLLYVNKQPDRR